LRPPLRWIIQISMSGIEKSTAMRYRNALVIDARADISSRMRDRIDCPRRRSS
jgi:hypothetical protein